jgi:DNA-binding CsgD family transcriptional regulator
MNKMQLHIHNDRLIEQDVTLSNQYLILISMGFFAFFLKDFIFQYYQLAFFDVFIMLSCILQTFIPFKNKLGDGGKLIVYGVILIFMLFFLLLFRFESTTLFYIPMTFSLGIYFDLNKNKFAVLLLSLLIVISIVLCYTMDTSTIEHSVGYKEYTDIANIVNSTLFSLFSIYIIVMRNQLLFSYQLKFNEKLESNVKTSIDSDTLRELNILVYNDYTVFYLRFKEKYPIFIHKIELLAPNLVAEEMKVVILIYMNYSTKEIAKITNSSFNAIQAKKHRIRKKLNISASTYIIDFLRSL